MSSSSDFTYQELIDAWLDGEATPEQTEQLRAWLKEDRENVRIFVRESHAHRSLREFAVADQLQLDLHQPSELPAKQKESRVRKVPSARVWMAAGVAAACLLLGFSIFQFVQKPDIGLATLVEFSGGVLIKRGAQNLTASKGFVLQPGDALQSSADGAAAIAFDDGTRVELKPNSDVTLQPRTSTAPARAGKRLRLASGAINAAFAKQPAGQPFILETPLAMATVLGTKLTLQADEDSSRLDVAEGQVQFERLNASEALDVSSGGYARFGRGSTACANAVRAGAGAHALRVVEDHEGALNWMQFPESVQAPFALSSEQAHGGRKSLRIAYQLDPADRDSYTEFFHPLTIHSGDRALRFWIFVVSSDTKTNWNIQFRLRDRTCWIINDGYFSALQPGWNEIEIDLRQPPQKQAFGDPVAYNASDADGLLFSVCTGSATFFLDDFIIVNDQP